MRILKTTCVFMLGAAASLWLGAPVLRAETKTTDTALSSASEDIRDPFVPLLDEKGQWRKNLKKPDLERINTEIRLSGITQINGQFYAFLDDQFLTVGDTINDFTITSINPHQVILSVGQKKFELLWDTDETSQ